MNDQENNEGELLEVKPLDLSEVFVTPENFSKKTDNLSEMLHIFKFMND